MVKVLIVEDSPVIRAQLAYLLDSDPEIEVVGTVADGIKAVEFVARQKPDVIIMDINMPRMNGFEATRKIMETNPVPIIIISASWDPQQVEISFEALRAGALTVLAKPPGFGHPEHAEAVAELLKMIKLMAEVKVIRRRFAIKGRKPEKPLSTETKITKKPGAIKVVVIGTSSGGPVVLNNLLSKIHADFPVPIVIVQHISKGFLEGLVSWLQESTHRKIFVAQDGETLLPGCVYFAPEEYHIGIGQNRKIKLLQGTCLDGSCPSASYLFQTTAEVFGNEAVGILLTGMGDDGAAELKLIHDKDGVTIAQNKESCTVFGMPGEAIKLGAAQYVLNPDEIASLLNDLTQTSNKQK
jgi:two-component system chemotaxis response regulator CheB